MTGISFFSLFLLSCGSADKSSAPDDASVQKKSYVKTSVEDGFISAKALQNGLTGSSLRSAKVSPDGSKVTFLQATEQSNGKLELWAFDLSDGSTSRLVGSSDLLSEPETLSEEEKNRRERRREYGSGIVDYSWVDAETLMFPLGGDIYLYDLITSTAKQATNSEGFETDPKVSPSSNYVAYVRDNELFVSNLSDGLEAQITKGATDVIRNATASFVVQEELKRFSGYWWSPNSLQIAYTQIDESPVAIENRIDFGAEGVTNISQRYPFAGTENATVKLGIVTLSSGQTVWVDLGNETDIYLTRVFWEPKGRILYAGILSGDHKTHHFLKIDPATGRSEKIFEETSPTWINVGTDHKALKGGGFLWSSEKSGRRQIYDINHRGDARQITPDSVLVTGVNCVDETNRRLYFSGWDDTVLERHLYSIGLDGNDLTKLTNAPGWHSASFASNCASYIGYYQDPNTPPQARAFNNKGEPLTWLSENKLDADHPYAAFLENQIQPEYGQIPAEDGTMMDYVLYKPIDLKPGEKRPSITYVYGGPGAQLVNKTWRRSLFPRMLAHHGYVVFTLDNRGMGNRGKAFEDPIYRAMGQVEVEDQSVGTEWLKQQDFIDPDRMGVYGWSYGGYMVLHMLAQTDHYKSGVSGAPVTDWALYDTAYTERYLGSPVVGDTNYTRGAYENGSVFAHIDGLTEDVLLIHGMADDNVVFRHSVKLMDVMQDKAMHNLRVMTYPGEKHGFRRPSNRLHRDQMILNFFAETLGE